MPIDCAIWIQASLLFSVFKMVPAAIETIKMEGGERAKGIGNWYNSLLSQKIIQTKMILKVNEDQGYWFF